MICGICGWLLRFDKERGWVHMGGGTIVWRCGGCGHTEDGYPTPIMCPKCGSGIIRDDHCVLPVKEKGKE